MRQVPQSRHFCIRNTKKLLYRNYFQQKLKFYWTKTTIHESFFASAMRQVPQPRRVPGQELVMLVVSYAISKFLHFLNDFFLAWILHFCSYARSAATTACTRARRATPRAGAAARTAHARTARSPPRARRYYYFYYVFSMRLPVYWPIRIESLLWLKSLYSITPFQHYGASEGKKVSTRTAHAETARWLPRARRWGWLEYFQYLGQIIWQNG